MNTQKLILTVLVGLLVLVGVGNLLVEERPPQTPTPTVTERAPPETPPNVLILLWDTVRADRLSIYDPSLQTTPRMKVWAEDGLIFEQAISPAMWTVPSHASMFTGLPPVSHMAGMEKTWLENHHITLAEHFTAHGYDSYAFSANPNLSPRRVNLLQGFNLIELSWGPRWKRGVTANARKKLLKQDASTEISPAWEGLKPAETQPFTFNAGPITQKAFASFLKRRPDKDKPWIAYLSYMEAHKPRIPTLEARRRLADEDDIQLQLQTDLSFDQQLAYSYGQRSYSEDELRAINQVYDATLIDLDEATADLLDLLEAKDLLDNTIVVLTSDHGEMLGEHQLFGHRQAVYQDLVRIPLVIRWPDGLQPGRVQAPVSNLDLYATLVDLAGLPEAEGERSNGNMVDQRLGPWGVLTETIDRDAPGYRRVMNLFPNLPADPWDRTFRALVDGQWKLITDSDGAESLFNLADDPHEHEDLALDHPERLAALKAQLAQVVQTLPAYDPSRRTAADEEVEESDEMKQRLLELGYLSDEYEDE